jgi:hypothetical protein
MWFHYSRPSKDIPFLCRMNRDFHNARGLAEFNYDVHLPATAEVQLHRFLALVEAKSTFGKGAFMAKLR